VFTHLRQNSANVEMYVTGVADLETVFYCLLAEMQVVVFNLKRFFQVRESRSQLLGPAEDARKIVIGNCAVTVPFLC
jgi:hypothetical protein